MKEALKKFFSTDGSLFRYAFSFSLLLAIFPVLVVLLHIFKHQYLSIDIMLQVIYDYLPQSVIEPLVFYVLNQEIEADLLVIISSFFSLFLASRAFYLLLRMIQLDEKITVNFIFIRIKAAMMFIGWFGALIVMSIINYWLSLNQLIVWIGLLLLLKQFYYWLSFIKRSFKYGLIGALFSSTAILLVGNFFFYYIENYTRYDNLYGPLANVMVMFISSYLIANIIYFGYCLNYQFYSQDTNYHKR